MIEVTLPNGSVAEFPDNMSREQIQGILAKQFPAEQQPVGSYYEQITQGSPQRQREMQRIQSQYEAGQITLPEKTLQGLGEGAGNIGDVMGRAMGDVTGGAYGMLPESWQQNIGETMQPIGEAIAPMVQGVADVYGDIKQEYPRTMENVEALTNIGMLAAPGLGRSGQVGGAVERGAKATAQKFLPKPRAMTSEQLKTTASALFKQADDAGGVLRPKVTNAFIDDVMREAPRDRIAKAVLGENPVGDLIKRLDNMRGQSLTLQGAKEIDEALGELAYKNINPVTGTLDKQGLKFMNLQSKFRNSIENATPDAVVGGKAGFEALKEARQYWAASLRLSDVEKAIAKGRATEQPQTGIKNAFKTLLNSKKIKNFSPAEVRAIEVAANKGVLTDVLGTMGSRLNPQLTGIGVGLATQDPSMGLAAFTAQTVGSGAARKAATALQMKKAKQVEDLIRQRVTGAGANQQFALTPEIQQLAREVGVMATPSGGVSALLDQLQAIQQTGIIPQEAQ